ncbi:MAG: pre-peptidase C-terminal domain-containing protein [Rhodopirellula sp.]|nr:pre-peptidase C-terminal domain-containing protein [Rhodopirellula sp.]
MRTTSNRSPASTRSPAIFTGTWLVCLFLLDVPASAELPSIRFDRLTPLGAAAGSAVEAEIVGADIEDVRALWFEHPGLTAEPVEGKDRRFKITVAPDVPAGTYDVRLIGRWGVSNPRLFSIDHGLTDVTDTEPNNEPSTAQVVAVNSAVAGMSDGNNEDVFRFTAKAQQRIVIDCQAGRLDSMLDATMSLSTSDGRLLASSSDYNGRDPLIDFVTPADGDYLVRVYDLSYRGGFPYRLLITDKSHIETVFPRAVQAGQEVELVALGQNLGDGSKSSSWLEADVPYVERKFAFAASADIASAGSFQFSVHPTDHSVLPTAATCTLTGTQFQAAPNGLANSQTLVVTDSPVTLEAEPNDSQEKPQAVTLPLFVSGRFDQPRDADWFEFEVAESGQYGFDVYCERINGHADPYLVVVDDKGNRINELDDFGHRINAFDGHLRDPAGLINLTEKRKYRVLVQDRYRRGGARYQYVLAIRKQQPDFYVAVIHSQNPGPGGTTVWRGGSVYMDVIIHQQQGYAEPITITGEDLPLGLHLSPTVINNNSRGTLVITVDDDAADFTGPIKLIATGLRGDETLRREVRPYSRVWNNAGMNSSRPTRDLVVAIRDGAPYRLEWDNDNIEVEAGKDAMLTLRLTRRWTDFKADVTVQPLSFPGNFKLSNTSFKGDQTELTIPITVQNNTRPGSYTLAVMGQAQVPFNKDSEAKDRPNTLVSLPSRPVTLRVIEAAKP